MANNEKISKTDTDVQQFIEDLEAGTFMARFGHVLSKVGFSVLDLEKMGEVTIKMKFKHMGAKDQIMCEHDLSYKRPMEHGGMSENISGKTPMYVGAEGLTLYPSKQEDAFFGDEKRPQESGPRSQKPTTTPSLVGHTGGKK